MASNPISCDSTDDEFIDMEVNSYNSILGRPITPACPREFEFQMSSASMERQPTTSPADELFYRGKLLPLHLPPRLQMVEKLLQNSSIPTSDRRKDYPFDEFYSTPLATNTAPTPTSTSTPFESCNISPVESCQVSRELNLNEYILEYLDEAGDFAEKENPKKSWMRKLKTIKQSFLGSKLKASRRYLKSLFGKPGCSDECCAAEARYLDERYVPKAKDSSNYKYMKTAEKTPFGKIQREKHQGKANDDARRHRRSFSVSLKWHSTNKLSSSSSISSGLSFSSSCSNSSNKSKEFKLLKRCSSANYEVENPIQGAIAYCKKSQQAYQSSETGFGSLSASRLSVLEDEERTELCRG